MKHFCIILLVLIVGTACTDSRTTVQHYYPVDSLLNSQITLLTNAKAQLTKKAFINGKEEVKTYVPKSDTAWRHELDIFMQLNDINKPSNTGKYKLESSVKDTNSNLLIYSLMTAEKLPVTSYKVYYLKSRSNIRKIEAHYYEENALLNSSRTLTLEFQDIHNKIVLTSYSIAGGQKMLLADSVTFTVNGSITLP